MNDYQVPLLPHIWEPIREQIVAAFKVPVRFCSWKLALVVVTVACVTAAAVLPLHSHWKSIVLVSLLDATRSVKKMFNVTSSCSWNSRRNPGNSDISCDILATKAKGLGNIGPTLGILLYRYAMRYPKKILFLKLNRGLRIIVGMFGSSGENSGADVTAGEEDEVVLQGLVAGPCLRRQFSAL